MGKALVDFIARHKRIVPVITLPRAELAIPLANTLKDGGFGVLEVTLRTDCAIDAIQRLRDQCPDLLIGAGTVKTTRQLELSIQAGAEFIVCPGLNAELVEQAIDSGVQIIPGVMTPSEILQAENLGLRTVKLFPASLAGGTEFIQSMRSVFPEMQFFPTGGITEDSVNEYLKLPNVLCAGGTWLTPLTLLEEERWGTIHEIAQRC